MLKKLPTFTLGVEEEYQIIDPETRDLRSHLSKIVDGAKVILNEQVKAEMHQSVVEVGTNICQNVAEANSEIRFLRSKIVELADKQGLVVGGAGTHPFSRWQDQPITDDPRYHMIVNELQDAARSNLIFGMHCHVGIENRDIGLQLIIRRVIFYHIFLHCLLIPLFGKDEIQVINRLEPKCLISFQEQVCPNILIAYNRMTII